MIISKIVQEEEMEEMEEFYKRFLNKQRSSKNRK